MLPQLIYLGLFAMGLGINLSRFGQPKRDNYDLIDVLFGPAIVLGLLWWGGFFTPLFTHG